MSQRRRNSQDLDSPHKERPVPPKRDGIPRAGSVIHTPKPNGEARKLPFPGQRGRGRGVPRGVQPGTLRTTGNPRSLARSTSAVELGVRGSPRGSARVRIPNSVRVDPSIRKQKLQASPAHNSTGELLQRPAVPPRRTSLKSPSLIRLPGRFGRKSSKNAITKELPQVPQPPPRRSVDKKDLPLISDTPQPASGPTRAYGKRSEFYKDDKINHRLSKNLAAPAVSLHFRLTDRPEYETLRSSMIIKEAVVPQPYATATWTSKIRMHDEWLPLEQEEEGSKPLINRNCLEAGYNIEAPRKEPPQPEDLELLDADKDVKFFEQLNKSGNISHFVGEKKSGDIVIVSMENQKSKKFQRALIRTAKEDKRLLITSTSSGKIIKNMCNQCPLLNDFKLTKIRKDESDAWTEELLKIESQMVERTYKFGVLYAAAGQETEDQFFNNVDGSEDFNAFLGHISSKVQLSGWKHFRGGLDVKSGTTGEFSYYQIHKGCEIMFHVSTLIPFYPKDEQQVERKRHLGNDIVVIIFKEGDEPFDPLCIRSQFNHVFAVVQAVHIEEGKTHYAVEWCAKPGVPPFKPYETSPAIYESGIDFQMHFITKLLNAQRAAMSAKDFQHKMSRTRKMLFNEILSNHPIRK